MRRRTDPHSPANIEPANYAFVTDFYIGSDEEAMKSYAPENRIWDAAMEANSLVMDRPNCHHCGAHYAYGVCYRYLPTNELINVGHKCAAETFSLPSRVAVNKRNAERVAAAARERARIALKAQEFLVSHPTIAALNDYTGFKSTFITDVLSKLFIYGELSERQVTALETAHTKMLTRQAEEAEAAKDQPEAEDCPTGRTTGTVISTKYVDSDFSRYGTLKMLVKDNRGFKLWGTVPSSLNCEAGDVITFTASLEASSKDSKFGFFKRPTKASIVTSAS